MRPNGTVDFFAMVRSLMKHPREVRALAETARDTFTAGITLSRVCSVFRSFNEPDIRLPICGNPIGFAALGKVSCSG